MIGVEPNRRLWPAALVLGLLVLILAVRERVPSRRPAPPSALESTLPPVAGAPVIPESELPPVAGTPAALESEFVQRPAAVAPPAGGGREPAATTARLRIYTSTGSYAPADAAAMAEPLEATLAYVEERTGLQLNRPVNIVFDRRPDTCGLDAVAYTDVRTLILYACPDVPTRRAINILAHEYVHQLAHDRYGTAHLQSDLILSEGLATWGAGRYWLGHESSFHDFVARQYGSRLLPLATDPRADVTIDTLNQLYYQWASYIEWLHLTYGWEAVEQLYGAGTGRAPGSAPYLETLGAGFSETEERWRAWLE